MSRTLIVCEYCCREFPEDSEGTETMCGECYRDKHCFICSRCEDYGYVEDQDAYVAIYDPEDAFCETFLAVDRTWRGLYCIDRQPYYTQGLLGSGWLWRGCLTWVAALPDDLEDPDGLPCGHFCADCQRKTLAEEATRRLPMMFAAYAATRA